MKKYFAVSIAIAAINCAYAEVIELDSGNAQNCIKQLSQAKNNMPVILEYLANCPFYHQFLPIFEKRATEHPELSYYKINDDIITAEVKDKCLGEGSAYAFISPKVSVNLFHAETAPFIIPLRSDIGSFKQPFSADDLEYLLRGIGNTTALPAQHTTQMK